MNIKVYVNNIYFKTINRKPFNKGFMGNFVPHYCRYKNEVHLIIGSIDYAYMHGYENDARIDVKSIG